MSLINFLQALSKAWALDCFNNNSLMTPVAHT